MRRVEREMKLGTNQLAVGWEAPSGAPGHLPLLHTVALWEDSIKDFGEGVGEPLHWLGYASG